MQERITVNFTNYEEIVQQSEKPEAFQYTLNITSVSTNQISLNVKFNDTVAVRSV